ncbi:hypothetical protein INT46_002279 [Mucor plumbeus]|uniref:Ribosomal protein L1 n=1 Tax=Mucor plumbeus TaxID=97098 RepID=A0A8H7RN42_9FUNG|nr:hypothetical protein INT46_002279 [Mucor plumbeus]
MVQKLDLQQAKKAIAALYKFNEKKADNDMLNNEEDNAVYVEINTHKVMNKAQSKQKQIKLPVSPYPETYEVCYFTKDDEKKTEEKTKNSPIKKVISLNSLKTVYKTYEAKRKLAASYDLFVVDDRVAPLIPSLLGKAFLSKNRMPASIKSTGSLKANVEKILQSTNVKLHNGLKTRILIGNFAMSKEDLLKNYEAALPEIVKIAAHNWDQVELLGIQCEGSPLLPIYTSFPKEESKKVAAAAVKKEDKKTPAKKAVAAENEEESVKKAAPAKKAAATTKKATPAKKTTAAEKKAAAPAKKAAAPAKKTSAAEKKIAVAPAKKTETKKVTKKVAAKNKK